MPCRMSSLDRFTHSYTEALYFSETGSVELRGLLLSDESILDIAADCRSFWRRFGCFIETEICDSAFEDSVQRAGYDFHYTRNGHGCGFWEEDWPQVYRNLLVKGAKNYGHIEVYEGDDGLLYVF